MGAFYRVLSFRYRGNRSSQKVLSSSSPQSSGPVRNLLWCWLSMGSRFLQGTSTAFRGYLLHHLQGTTSIPMVFSMDFRKTFTSAPLPSASPVFVSVGLFCSYSYSSLPAALFRFSLNKNFLRNDRGATTITVLLSFGHRWVHLETG